MVIPVVLDQGHQPVQDHHRPQHCPCLPLWEPRTGLRSPGCGATFRVKVKESVESLYLGEDLKIQFGISGKTSKCGQQQIYKVTFWSFKFLLYICFILSCNIFIAALI